jgi:hypothetical protein
MTATMEHTLATVTQELVDEVREQFEEEYLALRDIERPALVEMLGLDSEAGELARVSRALTILDYQLAAIRDFLGSEDGTTAQRAGSGSCVYLDQGEGPRWFLLAALPFEHPRVLASDSALGRAVLGVPAGQSVVYPTPNGLQTARVLAVEARA